jgi:hypothetical protein
MPVIQKTVCVDGWNAILETLFLENDDSASLLGKSASCEITTKLWDIRKDNSGCSYMYIFYC